MEVRPNWEYRRAKNSGSGILGLSASIITIFAFLTGIDSLPILMGATEDGESLGLFGSGVGRRLSIGVLILSQVAYFVSLYILVRSVKALYLPSTEHGGGGITFKATYSITSGQLRYRCIFLLLISMLFGMGISFLFMETIWNPLPILLDQKDYSVLFGFGLFALVGNFLTVWTGYEFQWGD